MNEQWSSEDRGAARAFLQRSEVRLSTLHRVATALLSGAGLMVLLPAMMRDQIAGVVGGLLTVEATLPHVLLAVVAAVVLALPLMVFFLLLGDLTRFYFHAQHVHAEGGAVFAPRFTLTGLRVPSDDLGPEAAQTVEDARSAVETVELVVPRNPRARASIDRRLRAYGGMGITENSSDEQRAAGLFELVASRQRTLAEEVAKVEFGMTRHLLRLQVIVMRYVKALLAFLVTALAVFAAAAVVARDETIPASGQLWLASIFALWAPVMVLAVSSPVRWVQSLLRAEGLAARSVSADHEFTRFERLAIIAGALVLGLSALVLVLRIVDGLTQRQVVVAVTVALIAVGSFAAAARYSVTTPSAWLGRRTRPRVR